MHAPPGMIELQTMATPDNGSPSLGQKKKKESCFDPVLAIALVIFLILFALMTYPSSIFERRKSWMARAQGTLRSLARSELWYQGGNAARPFGSFQALQDSDYIAKGYSVGNMIENYSIKWDVQTLSTAQGEINEFTIIAWPRDTRKGFLSTFGVTEDEIVRIYNPKNRKSRLGNVKTWDPIL
jgi:hypothetical protein